MIYAQITATRMTNQHLLDKSFTNVADVVKWLGAVQAQDYAMAKWALGLRVHRATDSSVEDAFNKGEIVRTHVMRPTWHFVLPEDVGWMQTLTSPRVKTLMGHYNRKLELTDTIFAKTNKLIVASLEKEKFLTRQQIKQLLENVGIKTDVQRLAHIVMWAELDGLIVSGPRIGKQFSYALTSERVKRATKLNHEESLATLAITYFTSHGPAQLKDFSWWSGLSLADSKRAVALAGSKIEKQEIDEVLYWLSTKLKTAKNNEHRAIFLSIYDEYTIAYKDRSALDGGRYMQKMMSLGNALTAVVILDGVIVGTWKRVIGKKDIKITLNGLRTFSSIEYAALEKAAHEYGNFMGLPVSIR